MLNKLFAGLLIAFSTLSMAPANAQDIPVLSWEKGKEHNIVLGGNSLVKNWKIQLVSQNSAPLDFTQSKIDPKGYVVFSVQIPDSYTTGVYTVESFDAAGFILDAIKAGNTPRESINNYISTKSFKGVSKTLKFDKEGEVAGVDVNAFTIKKGKIVLLGQIK